MKTACAIMLLLTPLIPVSAQVITDWGPVTYVSDTAHGTYYFPRIVATDSLLHVFGSSNVGPHHYVSFDNGQTWIFYADLRNPDFDNAPGAVNCFAQGSMLYIVYVGRHRGDGFNEEFIHFRASNDYGSNWQWESEIKCSWIDDDARRPNITGHGDTLFVVFSQGDSLTIWRSTNMGLDWNMVHIFDCISSYWPAIEYHSNVVSLSFGMMAYDYPHFTDVYYIRSTDEGETWSDPLLIGFPDDRVGSRPAMWADSNNLVICWNDALGAPEHSSHGGIWCSISRDNGARWEPPMKINSDYLAQLGHSVVISGNYIGVAWTAFSQGVLYRESYDGGITWEEEQIVREIDSMTCYESWLQLNRGFIHLAWLEDEWVNEEHVYRLIKYARNDCRTDVEGPFVSDDYAPASMVISCAPNPFNSDVVIDYSLTQSGPVRISVYNTLGRRVAELFEGNRDAGNYSVLWNASDFSSGVYFVALEAGDFSKALKVTLLK